MIAPNLLVRDLSRSARFYTQSLGFDCAMVLTSDNNMVDDYSHREAVFATLLWQGHQLMLQTRQHLQASGAPNTQNDPVLSGYLYLRDFAWDAIIHSLPPGALVRGPKTQWYGMAEIIVRDPDGYTWVLGRREGAPPQ